MSALLPAQGIRDGALFVARFQAKTRYASRLIARDIENVVVDQLSRTLALGSEIQSMLEEGTYKAEQLTTSSHEAANWQTS